MDGIWLENQSYSYRRKRIKV